MSDIRAHQILQKQIEGKNQIQIADELGVSRMTVYRDRQTDLYQDIVDELKNLYINNLKDFMKGDALTYRMEGTKEFGRIVRTGFTRQTRHTEDITIKASIDITEQRKEADALIKQLELSPDQYKVLEERVKPENLEK